MFTLFPLPARRIGIVNPKSRTPRNFLAKEGVTLIHGFGRALEAKLITQFFPVNRETALPVPEIMSRAALGDQVIGIPRAEVIQEYCGDIIKGSMYLGLKEKDISTRMATVEQRWLVDGEVLIQLAVWYSAEVLRDRGGF